MVCPQCSNKENTSVKIASEKRNWDLPLKYYTFRIDCKTEKGQWSVTPQKEQIISETIEISMEGDPLIAEANTHRRSRKANVPRRRYIDMSSYISQK